MAGLVQWTGGGFDLCGASDWSQSNPSALDFIKSKPTLGTASAQNVGAFATSAQGSTADSALQPSGNGSSLTGLIQSQISGLIAALAAKFATPAGTTLQYVRGDGTLATFLTDSITNNPSRTIQTMAAAANGWRPSGGDVRTYKVIYSVSLSSTATIGGASVATAVLETAATNSTTAADWTTVGKISNGQTITLAIALQSVQTAVLSVSAMIPAGSYVRLRSVLTGTSSASFDSGQEILM